MKALSSNYSLSLLSGILLALAWPETGVFFPLIFVGFVPLLILEQKLRNTEQPLYKFTLFAFLAFFVFNLLSLRWLFLVSEPLSVRIVSVLFPPFVNGILMALTVTIASYVVKHVGKKEGYIAFVLFWLGFEYLHSNWEFQFPWLNLGNVFANQPWLIRWYAITGVQGGTLWIWLVNILVFFMWKNRWFKKSKALIGLVVLLVIPFLWSLLINKPESSKTIEVGIVQPNYDPYSSKFYTDASLQVDEMLELSKSLGEVDWLVWPETALQENAVMQRRQRGIDGLELYGLWNSKLEHSNSLKQMGSAFDSLHFPNMLVGMSSRSLITKLDEVSFAARSVPSENVWYVNYNSALYLTESSTNVYHKNKLVAGVETFPYASLLKPLESLILDMGGTTGTLGKSDKPVVFGDSLESVAPMICYESIFGEYVGEFVKKGARWIAVMTNDGWWGNGAGYKQHLAYARLLAVSHQRYVVRSANTGISCVINDKGDFVVKSDWWQAQAIKGTVELHDHQTFYTQHGDYLGRNAAFLAILVWCLAIVRKRKQAN